MHVVPMGFNVGLGTFLEFFASAFDHARCSPGGRRRAVGALRSAPPRSTGAGWAASRSQDDVGPAG